ncbi:phosphoribosylglycinamide formyltransferase [Carboxydochorda subterranea]|uniref:Phosphoribosylglycinamide formyltransferase n=1 Tax=Carboxydichorda subterranea TaxID=3109565 RepID=A0ABZ1BVZ2_9FIRM|nr:phosphoribosylglycinamide formyltransferase [Limnochorda sp. L945t]WRP16844.1 phosphoribosylglycinamide formyltransferase [Limnochorda sp. L945t]
MTEHVPARPEPLQPVALGRRATGTSPLRLGVLASGRGTNLQAILDACVNREVPARVVLVISDKPQAQALERARAAGVLAEYHDPRIHPGRASYDRHLADRLEEAGVELVCLAGFMRILGSAFVERFRHRILNIHPSLLPAFPGKDAQRQALEHGVKVSGCTVHLVDEGVDTGPIVLQAAVPVLEGDTEESLAERILQHEHRLYVEAIRLYAAGRLQLEGRRVRIVPGGACQGT